MSPVWANQIQDTFGSDTPYKHLAIRQAADILGLEAQWARYLSPLSEASRGWPRI